MTLIGAAALLTCAFGVIAALSAAIATGDRRAGLAMLLELWTAAALLRLTASDAWLTLGAVALLLLVRVIVARRRHRARSDFGSPRLSS